ncbi:hypothetical protein FB567DRAFT_522762 [Paraphoma chrysanthemicola]|uniref:Uncharacterized protein n=1 Tax=Paraphoma chrysanthemicola TaxID=798071 RepID=A0A8K0VZQ2_9PLEO|nr:hypothetical protein FB567DRAFT_522762 [Paraphoma chrysanthemicola]
MSILNPSKFAGVHARRITADCVLLCPAVLNVTSDNHYYIDFPAARLAFISSGSATVSFALLAVIMSMQSYSNAASFIHASAEVGSRSLPGPYQMSLLLRVLNAELIVLWDLSFKKIRSVFWYHEKEESPSDEKPRMLKMGIIVLIAGFIASILVQAADVYFHVAAESVQIVQLQESTLLNRQFSRGLAPWCLNKPKYGDDGEEKLWGCAITAQSSLDGRTSLAPTNQSTISDMKNDISDQHKTITFTDRSGMQYALVGPADHEPSLDWKAASFGVSSTCSAIPDGGCAVAESITNATDARQNPINLVPFQCTKAKAGLDITGTFTSFNTALHMMNFHKYSAESPPFFNTTLVRTSEPIARNFSETNDIFRNKWTVLVMRKIPSAVQGDFSLLPPTFATDDRIWKHGLLGAFFVLHCNVTVWDVTYKSVSSNITILDKVPSNGTVAGMASMPATRQIGTLTNVFQDESTGPLSRKSPDDFIRSFELGMSKAYSYAVASQMNSRPSLMMQSRTLKVVTRLPHAALWCLVAANFVYAVLGLVVAICALLKINPEVGQVQVRLGVSGLLAALFTEREQFERPVASEDELFGPGSNGAEKYTKIAVIKTTRGGSSYMLVK